jgi:hypothetical protein
MRGSLSAQTATQIADKIAINIQSPDAAVRLPAEVAKLMTDSGIAVISLERKVYDQSRGEIIGDIDIETDKYIIEVSTTETNAKRTQLTKTVGNSVMNPTGKPVLYYAPSLELTFNRTAEIKQSGATLYTNIDDLLARLSK